MTWHSKSTYRVIILVYQAMTKHIYYILTKLIFIPMMAMFLLIGVLSVIWPSASPVYALINNQASAATIDQPTSNLTQSNSELPIKQQLKAEILVPIFYNNGTSVEPEKYRILFEELVKQFGAVSSEDYNIINGYWINPQDNKAYADKNKVYWTIVQIQKKIDSTLPIYKTN